MWLHRNQNHSEPIWQYGGSETVAVYQNKLEAASSKEVC
jgi:hypothetical protein